MAAAPNSYLVVSTVKTSVDDANGSSVSVAIGYIGSFADEAAAQTHADGHNKLPNTTAVVATLINPANC